MPGVVQQLGGEAVVPAAAAGVVVDVVLLLARLYRPPRPGQHYCQYPAAVSTSGTTSAVIGDFQLKTLFHDPPLLPEVVTVVSGGQTDRLVTQLGHL